jgi:hypothetical protein
MNTIAKNQHPILPVELEPKNLCIAPINGNPFGPGILSASFLSFRRLHRNQKTEIMRTVKMIRNIFISSNAAENSLLSSRQFHRLSRRSTAKWMRTVMLTNILLKQLRKLERLFAYERSTSSSQHLKFRIFTHFSTGNDCESKGLSHISRRTIFYQFPIASPSIYFAL